MVLSFLFIEICFNKSIYLSIHLTHLKFLHRDGHAGWMIIFLHTTTTS